MIEPEPLQQTDGTYVLSHQKKLSYFSGCDYFRMSWHPKVRAALVRGLRRYGLNVAASRYTSGNHRVYRELEASLARFFKAEMSVLVPSGYVANLAVAQALAGQFSHVLIDELAHPSLRDASLAMECPVIKFRHRTATDVRSAVERCGNGCRPILFTDGMFSRDGSAAPLREYVEALPGDGYLLVDDAHGAGVLGKGGRGSIELAGLKRTRVIQTITLSKAFGVYGGAILGSNALRRRILPRSGLVVGSTPLPLPLIQASLTAISILTSSQPLRSRLARNTQMVREPVRAAGLLLPETPGPVIAVEARNSSAVPKIKNALLKATIYPPFIFYPGGPVSGYFRFVISSEHTSDQLENLSACLGRMAPLLSPLT